MADHVRSEHSDLETIRASIYKSRIPLMMMGIALIVTGAIAIAYPLAAAVVLKIMLGWILLIAGFSQLIFAFSTTRWTDFFLELLIGLLFVVVGSWLAFFPLAGIVTLTLLIAVTFIVQGVLEVISAFRYRPLDGWMWVLFAGIVAIGVGLMILGRFPSSAEWAIGLLVGINLIASGIAYMGLAMSVRRLGRPA